jgi:predicted CXXCH cytochrome family protein
VRSPGVIALVGSCIGAALVAIIAAVASADAPPSGTPSGPAPVGTSIPTPPAGDPATSADPHARPSSRVQNCTTSGCHAKEIDFAFLHAPVAAGACDVCHKYDDDVKHTFTLRHEGQALCNFCHIGKTDNEGLHVHKPVAEGKCIGCHNPHGSVQRRLIKANTTSEMCLSCHASVLEGKPHVHSPIAKGDCLGCHKAHTSELPKLMVEEGKALCLRCHENIAHPATLPPSGASTSEGVTPADPDPTHGGPRVLAAHETPADQPSAAQPPAGQPPAGQPPAGQPSFIVHKPLEGECTQCHDQHASKEPALLKQPVAGLCTSCHEPIAQSIAGSSVKHSAVTVDRACLNCHTPHTSTDQNLLRSVATKLCLECHNAPVKRADGTMVESVASMKEKGHHLHGPLVEGLCSGCHDVHGGSHRALLVKPYSQEFYQPFESNAYDLCFSCHKRELVTEQTTASSTGFRNGEENLHYTHVIAPGANGRSCRGCHATHSAKNDRQLREATPFGQWEIPIRFTQTANGGTCAAGCHQSRTYDRITAVPKPEPTPRTGPSR